MTVLAKRKTKTKRLQAVADGPGPKGSWTKGWPDDPTCVGYALIQKRQRVQAREEGEWVIRLDRAQAQRLWQLLGSTPMYDNLDGLYAFLDQTFGDKS